MAITFPKPLRLQLVWRRMAPNELRAVSDPGDVVTRGYTTCFACERFDVFETKSGWTTYRDGEAWIPSYWPTAAQMMYIVEGNLNLHGTKWA